MQQAHLPGRDLSNIKANKGTRLGEYPMRLITAHLVWINSLKYSRKMYILNLGYFKFGMIFCGHVTCLEVAFCCHQPLASDTKNITEHMMSYGLDKLINK